MQCQDTYKEVREFKYHDAIVRVYIPDITEEERKIRIEQVKRAVINMFKE